MNTWAEKMWRTDKNDWRLVNIVLLIVLVVSAVPFVGTLTDWVGGKPLQVQTGAIGEPPPVNEPGLAPGVSGVYSADAVFTLPDAGVGQWLMMLVAPLLTLVVAVVCLWQVRRLVGFVRRQDPFHARAHTAVRVLASMIFLYGLFEPLLREWMTAMVTVPMRSGELNFVSHLGTAGGWPVVVGLLVGVVGESIFKTGGRLAEDTEGLV